MGTLRLLPSIVAVCLGLIAHQCFAIKKADEFGIAAEKRNFLHNGDARIPPGLAVPSPGFPTDFDGVPPGFEKVLPEEVLNKLRELHKNKEMPFHQKQVEFDRIMSSVPGETLAKLPLPPGFETLPEEVQQQIRKIHGDQGLDWGQKHRKVAQLVESLPAEQRPRPPSGFPPLPPNAAAADFFPPNPPPGFEKVLPPQVYQQLVDIHRNPQLGVQEKSRQIDQVMRALPQDIVDQLPLPPGFDQLPDKFLKQARRIFGDKSISFQEKDQRVAEFVRSLPSNLRQLVRPPLPPAFERLNPEAKEKIVGLFEDDTLDDGQRQKRFWELVNGLPAEQKAQLEQEMKFPPGGGTPN